MRKLKAENSKDFSQGHMGDKDPPAGVLHSYLQMDQAGSLRSDSASWERLQLEQPPNLGAPIWPPTEPAGDSVLSWDLPPQWVPLRSLSSKQRALSGAFSHQSFGSFFRLPPGRAVWGKGLGQGTHRGQTQQMLDPGPGSPTTYHRNFLPRTPWVFLNQPPLWILDCDPSLYAPAPHSGLGSSSPAWNTLGHSSGGL